MGTKPDQPPNDQSEQFEETEKPKARGRPPKEIPKIDATPEDAARAIFSAVKPADPRKRPAKPKRDKKDAAGQDGR